MKSYLSAMIRFGDFHGRSNRLEFWGYFVVLAIISALAQYAAVMSQTKVPIANLVALLHVIPSTTLQIRRLHDTGRSGYWLWIGLTVIGIIPLLYWLCQKGAPPGSWHGGTPLGLRTEPGMDAVEARGSTPQHAPGQLGRDSFVAAVTYGSHDGVWGLLIALVIWVGVIAFGWTYWRDQLGQFVTSLHASYAPAAAATSREVLDALKARGLEKVLVLSGSNVDVGVNGMPLAAIAACMAGKTAFGEPRNVAFYDEGSRNYRFVMTDPTNGDIAYHFQLIRPGLAQFDEVASSTEQTTDPDRINFSLGAVLVPCFNPKG